MWERSSASSILSRVLIVLYIQVGASLDWRAVIRESAIRNIGGRIYKAAEGGISGIKHTCMSIISSVLPNYQHQKATPAFQSFCESIHSLILPQSGTLTHSLLRSTHAVPENRLPRPYSSSSRFLESAAQNPRPLVSCL
jgi:hypothetical protein